MANSENTSKPAPIIVLGWDGAEWDIIETLCEAKEMPHLQALRACGSEAHIASLQPMLSPLLWTSVATGKRAHEHGVLGFVEESMEGPRPISSRQRKVPALWNILSEAGYRSQVLNWWPSNPPEVIKGDFISNLAFADAPLANQSYPESWQAYLNEVRQSSAEITPSMLAAFLGDFKDTKPPEELKEALSQILKRAKWQFEMSMEMLNHAADCRFFYFEALDQIQHLANRYLPASKQNLAILEMIRAAYRWHDAMLGSVLSRAEGHNIFLLSDHGFDASAERQKELPNIPAAPASEHKPYGVFIAAGPDLKAKANLFGLSLLDLAPSLLHHFQIPLGKDLPGRVALNLFKKRRPLSFIPSWNGLTKTQFVATADHLPQDMLRDLEALEYIDLKQEQAGDFIREEQDYNQAISLKETGAYAEALAISNRYWQQSRQAYRWFVLKGRLHLSMGDNAGFKQFWESLSAAQQSFAQLQFYAALNALQAGAAESALQMMQELISKGFASPALFSEMGHALLLSGNLKEAEVYFDKALKINQNFSAAWNGKAQVAFENADFEGFQSYANQSLALKIFQPHLHYLWAQFYHQQGEKDSAQKALQTCFHLAPKHQKARQLEKHINPPKPSIPSVVVSGFPRSGTSLMMALLQKAGLPIIRDEQRAADAHNPNGYFEWEDLKQLPFGASLPATEGKAIKVVAPLLSYLPADRNYKVLWMDRPIMELILSQAKMQGEEASLGNFPFQKGQQLEAERQRYLNWLVQQPHLEFKLVSYPELCSENGHILLADINAFLELEITKEDWQKTMNPQLHRNKIG